MASGRLHCSAVGNWLVIWRVIWLAIWQPEPRAQGTALYGPPTFSALMYAGRAWMRASQALSAG